MLTRRTFITGLVASAACRPLLGAVPADASPLRKIFLTADAEKLDAAQRTGDYGVISIRSQDRLDRLLNNWLKFGVIKSDSPLVNINYATESIIGVFDCGDVGNKLELGTFHKGAGESTLDVFLTHIIYKQRGKVENKPKLLLAVVPITAGRVLVKTWTPQNGGAHDSPEKALTEWSGVVGPETGDSVGGLQGHITPAATKVKAGDDILLEFRLQLSDGDQKTGAFSRRGDKLFVWDGKYSNGYRNHAFHVVRPDGTIDLLRPKEQREWGKNAPHEVEISAGNPYVLPNWVEGKNLKSLKELGLKTEQGTYKITGVYTEVADEPKPDRMRRLIPATWGGEIWTNTVTVEVG